VKKIRFVVAREFSNLFVGTDFLQAIITWIGKDERIGQKLVEVLWEDFERQEAIKKAA
jgi:hypothetical protein